MTQTTPGSRAREVVPKGGAKRCGAIKSDGQPCRAYVVPGSNRCKFHGGATPRGIASHMFKDGKYSKYLPTGLLEIYQQTQQDGELLSLEGEIRLVDVRIRELLGQLEAGPSDEIWEKALGLVGSIRAYVKQEEYSKVPAVLEALDRLVLEGSNEKEVWQGVLQLMETRRRLVEGERKRLVEMNHVITSENAMVLVVALASAVKKHVTDKSVLNKISRELVHITAGQPGEVLGSVRFPE